MFVRRFVLGLAATLSFFLGYGQDEGPAVARARFDYPNALVVSAGLTRVYNKNVGNYTWGKSFDFSYSRRLNRVISVGGSVSHSEFDYDPTKTPVTPTSENLYQGFDYDAQLESTSALTYKDLYAIADNYEFLKGFQLTLEGGRVALTSIGLQLKIDLIPLSEKTPFSVYLLARPFVAISRRGAVTGKGTMYLYQATVKDNNFTTTTDEKWYPTKYTEIWGPQNYKALEAVTVLTGGLQFGPGIEWRPGKRVSIQLNTLMGYTLPVSFVSTRSYEKTLASYTNPEFPMVKKGFPALGLYAGVAWNF